jgi:hypothetical protein
MYTVNMTDFPGAINVEFPLSSSGPTNEAVAVAAEAAMDAFVDSLNTQIPALSADLNPAYWTGARNDLDAV